MTPKNTPETPKPCAHVEALKKIAALPCHCERAEDCPWIIARNALKSPCCPSLAEVEALVWEAAAKWAKDHPRRWRLDLYQDYLDKAAALRKGGDTDVR